MQGRMYTVTTKHSAIAGVLDFQELTAASGKPLCVHKVEVTQDDNETSQQVVVEIIRGTATSGTGGSAIATGDVEKMDPSGAAHGFTGEKGNPTRATETDGKFIWRSGQNAVNGWIYAPTPEERPGIAGGGRLAIGTPTTTISPALSFTVVTLVEEVG